MTRLAVLVATAIGAALVARAAIFYGDGDRLAYGLVLLIGAGLLLGAAEQIVRAARAARLGREIAAMPRPATPESVLAASPALRALLEARIAGSRVPLGGAVFTPYLVGLLVMIGLIGTFLGLFETLRGAREALTTSGNVDALRAGLAAPMSGLTRAFGTSAAGVAASAMLGLAAVFVRRAEGAVARALAAYEAGPLSHLTLPGRQLAALEAIARQGDALPAAAESLRRGTDALERLEASLAASHARTRTETAAAVMDAVKEIRGELESVIARAATATEAAVAPLLEQAVAKSAGAAARELARWTERVEADSVSRAGAITRVLDGARDALDARAATDRERDVKVAELVATLARTTDEVAGGAARHAAQIEAITASLGARAGEADGHAKERMNALVAHTEKILAEQAARQGSLVAHTGAVLAEQAARQATLEARLDAARTRDAALLGDRLAEHARGVSETLAATGALVREAADLMRAGGAETTAAAELFTGAVDRYREASDRALAGLERVDDAVDRAGKSAAVDLLGDYLDQTREVFDHALQFQKELFTELAALRRRDTATRAEPKESTDARA